MPAHRLTFSALVALIAATGLTHSAAVLPAVAAKPDSVPQTHVYPGGQPLSGAEQPSGTAAGSAEQPQGDFGSAPEPTAGDAQSSAATSEQSSAAGPAVSPEEQEAQQLAQLQARATQHYQLGSHYFGKWDLDLAEVEYDETVSIYPEYRVAHRDLCLLSLAKLNLGRSLAEFMMVTGLTDPVPYTEQEQAALNDKAMKAHYNKALAYGKKSNWTEAITELLWAQQYAPTNSMVHHSLAFAYASSGDFVRAEQEYKTVFKDAPGDGMAHADFANMLADRGNSARAEDEMRQAVELAPNAAALHVDLGWLAESRKDLSTAENEFKAAVKLSPKHAGLWTHLGRIEENSGDVADAEKAYAQALQLDAQSEEARAGLERLKQQPKPDATPAITDKHEA